MPLLLFLKKKNPNWLLLCIRVAPDALSYIYSFSIIWFIHYSECPFKSSCLLIIHLYDIPTLVALLKQRLHTYHFTMLALTISTEDNLPLKHVLWIRSYFPQSLFPKCLKWYFHSSLFWIHCLILLWKFLYYYKSVQYTFFRSFTSYLKVSLKKIYLLLYFYRIPHECNLEI